MFFKILFFISIFIIFFGEFLYPKVISFLPKKSLKKSRTLPKITVLIPVYNEESAIENKIKNTLRSSYPKEKQEIVVIDNGSSDATREIVNRFKVTLLESERGKVNALNKGLAYAKTDVIVITDADTLLSEKSIENAVSSLEESVGAVQGFIVSKAMANNLLMQEKEKYRKNDWELRYQESRIDSVCNLDGKFIAFKRSVFSGFPKNALVDDYIMTFTIRGKGLRLIVDRTAMAYEILENNLKEEFRQFKRYALTVLILNFKNIKFLFNPKYGFFGLFTFPFRRFFPVLYPILFLYSIGFLLSFGISKMANLNLFMIILIYSVGILSLLFVMFFLWFYKRLMAVQFLATFCSYFDLFKKNNLKSGTWDTIRKK